MFAWLLKRLFFYFNAYWVWDIEHAVISALELLINIYRDVWQNSKKGLYVNRSWAGILTCHFLPELTSLPSVISMYCIYSICSTDIWSFVIRLNISVLEHCQSCFTAKISRGRIQMKLIPVSNWDGVAIQNDFWLLQPEQCEWQR